MTLWEGNHNLACRFNILFLALVTCLAAAGCQASQPSGHTGLKYVLVTQHSKHEVLTESTVIRAQIPEGALPETALPSSELISDTVWSIWERERKQEKNGVVYLYLPKMDPTEMAYAVGRFTNNRLSDFHVNETALRNTVWYSAWERHMRQLMGSEAPAEPAPDEDNGLFIPEGQPEGITPVAFVETP